MKHTRRIASLLLALVMVFAMAISASAESDPATPAATGTITITNSVSGEEYSIIKLFDASVSDNSIVYTGNIPDDLKEYFTADTNGYITATSNATGNDGKLSANAVADIKAWAEKQTATATKTADGANLTFDNVSYGYYVVLSTQGAVISVDSTNRNAEVTDKNTAPVLDKEITGAHYVDEAGEKAMQEVGKNVTYTSYITVGKGAKKYVYHDTMEANKLAFVDNSVSVTLTKSGADSATSVAPANYEVTKNTTHTELNATVTHTFDVDFTDDFEATLEEGDVIAIEYQATILSDALQEDPANNTASLTYGNNGKVTTEDVVVYNAKFTVTKQDGNKQPLAGAGFVIAKTEGEGENAKTLYYKIENNVVSWVESIDNATENVSDAQGNVASFTGLANGTYTLVEKTVPAGYNKAADESFTIADGDYTAQNLIQATTVVNQSGSELPSTGGMGTTLFYVVGGLMVLAAVVLLVTKKRMASAE